MAPLRCPICNAPGQTCDDTREEDPMPPITRQQEDPRQRVALGAEPLAGPAEVTFSTPHQCDLDVYRGDSGVFRVAVTDATGAPVDVSAATWDCDIRKEPDALEALATLTVTPVPNATGQVQVTLTATESAKLPPGGPWAWDLQVTMGTQTQTLVAGAVNVTADVSRVTL